MSTRSVFFNVDCHPRLALRQQCGGGPGASTQKVPNISAPWSYRPDADSHWVRFPRIASAMRIAGDDSSPYLKRANIGQMAGNRGRSRHRRRYQMGAPAAALTAFEIAVGGGGAAFARGQLVGIHRQAHGAARIAPFKAGFDKDLVQAFFLGLMLHQARARHHDGVDAGRNLLALRDCRRRRADPRSGHWCRSR